MITEQVIKNATGDTDILRFQDVCTFGEYISVTTEILGDFIGLQLLNTPKHRCNDEVKNQQTTITQLYKSVTYCPGK